MLLNVKCEMGLLQTTNINKWNMKWGKFRTPCQHYLCTHACARVCGGEGRDHISACANILILHVEVYLLWRTTW